MGNIDSNEEKNDMKTVNVVGAGLSGLSAGITLAKSGIACNLISSQASERAQSVLAEGGINAAMDSMGENDTVRDHYEDTMRGGCYLEAESAIQNLTCHAPEVLRELLRLGVPFRRQNGKLILRSFGGQKKKRTAYTKAGTGKTIMTALIDEARRYEVEGLIQRWDHYTLVGIKITERSLTSITIKDEYTGKVLEMSGPAILCTGGMNGIFDEMTTGTTQNTGNADAIAFDAGVCFANLEFIQYHPTTIGISNKRMLISEAARGEGGRLYILRKGEPWYFMEEKYPVLKNLMPRDVVSREMVLVTQEKECEGDIYLDMTSIEENVWKEKLSDLRSEIISYTHLDPKTTPIPVSPGIHFFMGGMRVDDGHETEIRGLYAAGEAACKYHGANRLGGNSMLGAIFGGSTAAKSAIERASEVTIHDSKEAAPETETAWCKARLRDILMESLGIVRTAEQMKRGLAEMKKLYNSPKLTVMDQKRVRLCMAMIKAAIGREESRGAHYRTDFPETKDEFQKISCARWKNGAIDLRFVPAENWKET